MKTNYVKERIFPETHNISFIQSALNKKAHEYLRLINVEYGQFFNNEQRTLMSKLLENDCIVVESDCLAYIMNQQNAIINDSALTAKEKKQEIESMTIPLAHGGRVFNDNKIHYYPTTLFNGVQSLSDEDILNKCLELLIHELLHFFIRPVFVDIRKNPSLKKVNDFVTEGLVDMTARDLMMKYGLYPTYNSEYGSNVLCIRELLSNIPDIEDKMNIIFQSSIEDLLIQTSNEFNDSQQVFIHYLNKDTPYDKLISKIAYIANRDGNKYESIKRFLYNFLANFQSKEDALLMLEKHCQEKLPDISSLISEIIKEYYQKGSDENNLKLS